MIKFKKCKVVEDLKEIGGGKEIWTKYIVWKFQSLDKKFYNIYFVFCPLFYSELDVFL